MKSSFLGGAFLVIVGLLAIVAYGSLFTVDEREQALVLQFGEVRRAETEPGLKLKIPFIQNVMYLDSRILDLNSPVQEVISSDQKRLIVDAFARYKITDPLQFFQSVGTVAGADARLATVLNSATRRVLGDASLIDIVREKRAELMARIREQTSREAEKFGITIVDVKIRRADLPEDNATRIYERMRTDRQQEAAQIRARGEEAARRITSRADRDVTVLKAEAEREAQQARGVGDGERNRIFAEAYGQDPDFFAFYRSMQAYDLGLGKEGTRLVITPDSDFFRYFGNQSGRFQAPAGPAAQ